MTRTRSVSVEWYGPQTPVRFIDETAGRLNDGAACVSAQGTQVRLLMALAVPADDYAFGVFAAEFGRGRRAGRTDAGAPAELISAAVGWSPALGC